MVDVPLVDTTGSSTDGVGNTGAIGASMMVDAVVAAAAARCAAVATAHWAWDTVAASARSSNASSVARAIGLTRPTARPALAVPATMRAMRAGWRRRDRRFVAIAT